MATGQAELILARRYYRNKAPGWVALINSRPFHFWGARGKSDAQALVDKANKVANQDNTEQASA